MELILLAAGRGTRMGRLTEEIPKPLVELRPGTTILGSTLTNLAALPQPPRALVVGGHCRDRLESYLAVRDWGCPLAVLHNPRYAETGPLASLQVGLAAVRGERVAIANGDTLFSEAFLQQVQVERDEGACLFVSRAERADKDDIVVTLDAGDGTVAAAQKQPLGDHALVSAGFLLLQGRDVLETLRRSLEALARLEQESGRPRPWHSLLEQLHRLGRPARARFVPRGSWHEFDTDANIADYRQYALEERTG